eukprot:m51a1_g1700 putative protein kinase domain containing protein (1000) ;mRNA; r:491915-496748
MATPAAALLSQRIENQAELAGTPPSSSPYRRIELAPNRRSTSPPLSSSPTESVPPLPLSPGALRESGSMGLPTAHQPSALPSERSIVCRICEQAVRMAVAEEHIVVCEKINKADMLLVAAEERIAETLRKIGETVGTAHEHRIPLDAAVELGHRCLLSDSAPELVRLSLQLRGSPRSSQTAAHLVDTLVSCVNEKISAIEEKEDLRQSSPSALITRAPFFFRRATASPAETADFQIIKPLTRGAYGSVYVARKVHTGDVFAIKAMSKTALGNKNSMATLHNERDVLVNTENPHVVKMYYCFASEDNVYIVMEFLPGGDCFSMLQSLGSLSEETARVKGVVHRDLKPDNMLIDKDGHIKLSDFDTTAAVRIRSTKTHQSIHAVGTPDYIAPEVLQGQPHGEDVDWWALGCVLYELVTGVPPFNADTVEQTFDNIVSRRLVWPDDISVSDDFRDCVERFLEVAPEKRLGSRKAGALDIRAHPFFAGLDWEQLRSQRAPFVPAVADDVDTSFFDTRQPFFGQPPPLADMEISVEESIPPADTFLASRSRDLVSLGASLPCALASACLGPLPVRCSPVLDLLVSSCASHDVPAAISLSRSPFRVADALLCGSLRCFLCPGEAWVCSGLDALECACSSGLLAALELLAGVVDPQEARRCVQLHEASGRGHAEVLQRLAEPPFGFGHAEAVGGDTSPLAAACRSGHRDVVAVLASPPYCLGPEDARAEWNAALVGACANGHADVLGDLALAPFGLGSEDAREWQNRPLRRACKRGRLEVVVALAGPPWLLGTEDARCRKPYSLGPEDARESSCEGLLLACKWGHAGVVAALSEPPFALGRPEALQCLCLRVACSWGHVDVVRALARPPYSLGPEDAREEQCLYLACLWGHSDVVRVLGEPPFSLGATDMREDSCAAVRVACARGHACVLRELARSPYGASRDDVSVADLTRACRAGHAAVVRALGRSPFCMGSQDADVGFYAASSAGNEDVLSVLADPPFSLGNR